MSEKYRYLRENFQAGRWQEPIIMEMGSPGQRGVIPPAAEPEIREAVGDVTAMIPEKMRRQTPPALPELSQPQVLRHYTRLSQETMGTDVNIDLGLGTCTMKYSPKINEVLARSPHMTEIHPLQDEAHLQGILKIVHSFGLILGEISGMDAFSFQPSAGTPAVYTNAAMIRAYHRARGEGERRNEIITTIFSHPADAATPATAGYKLVTLFPNDDGYPDIEALRAALSDRTAGLMVTNPEDTGIFNPRIREFTEAVHNAGGLCAIDQANANGILGVLRARDLGFDMCHFNLHKTFSSPHGSEGPACGAVGVRQGLARFLPVPVVAEKDGLYHLDYDRPDSIGKIRAFLGNLQVVLKAYAWVMMLGPDGLKDASRTAILNNNYLAHHLSRVPGVAIPYAEGRFRLQEVRYSWQKLKEDTGVGTLDVNRRIVDYGVNNYFSSHEPWIVPEPFTLEPTESYSQADLDEYAEIIRRVSEEAYENPDMVRSAPHRSSARRIDETVLTDPARLVTTWRAWKKRQHS